jgi:hypothetical protein
MQFTRENFFKFIKKKNESKTRVGTSTQYYMNIFDAYYPRQWFIKWNWVGFFFPAIWLAYRRMYLYLGALWGVTTLGSFVYLLLLERMLHTPSGIRSAKLSMQLFVLTLVSIPSLLIGLYGNSLYFHFIEKKLRHQKNVNLSIYNPSWMSVVLYMAFSFLMHLLMLQLLKYDR